MTRFRARLVLPIALALVLVGSTGGVASASSPWISGCSGQANAGYLCIYSDRDFAGWRGHESSSNINYSGQTYPGSTVGVNDSVSSMMNLFSSYDVVWYHDAVYNGSNLCVPSNWEYSYLGLFDNDAMSSHLVAIGSTC
jgi:hypothetical protein